MLSVTTLRHAKFGNERAFIPLRLFFVHEIAVKREKMEFLKWLKQKLNKK